MLSSTLYIVIYFGLAVGFLMFLGFMMWLTDWRYHSEPKKLAILANAATIYVLIIAILSFASSQVIQKKELERGELISIKRVYYETERNLRYLEGLDNDLKRLSGTTKPTDYFSVTAIEDCLSNNLINDMNFLVELEVLYTQISRVRKDLNLMPVFISSDNNEVDMWAELNKQAMLRVEKKIPLLRGNFNTIKKQLSEILTQSYPYVNRTLWDEELKKIYPPGSILL